MTREEFRESYEYKKCMDKIKSYPTGFEFTIHYQEMRKGQANAMRVLLDDCEKAGLISSIAIDLNLELEQTAETFIKL